MSSSILCTKIAEDPPRPPHIRHGDAERLREWSQGEPFTPAITLDDPLRAPLQSLWPDYREQMEQEILFCLAGYAAEWIHLDANDEEADESELLEAQEMDGGDGLSAYQIALALTMGDQEAFTYVSLLRERARNLLDFPECRRAVKSLVTVLLDDGEAEEDVASAIMWEQLAAGDNTDDKPGAA